MAYHTGTFLVGAHWFGVPFPKLITISGIFWVLLVDYSLYKKTIPQIFVYLFICEVATTKVNFHFYKQCSQAKIRLICKGTIFAENASIIFLTLKFLYTTNKIIWKNYVRFWKWNLKHTHQSTQNLFSRKFDFVCQLLGFNKD